LTPGWLDLIREHRSYVGRNFLSSLTYDLTGLLSHA
jgi:hypothetical protein